MKVEEIVMGCFHLRDTHVPIFVSNKIVRLSYLPVPIHVPFSFLISVRQALGYSLNQASDET